MPAAMVAILLVFILIEIDYGPDPAVEVGTTLWGSWALFCGYYFKSKRFFWAGTVLLGFVALGLLIK
ncbi:MAG: hypothetical protein GY928_18805 [Colwellia sp.]|nr:hypothetical protein [Colwellia sp.]